MQTFKIATWNVNSLRVRLPQVLAWLNQVKPDILALQETKLQDSDFPISVIQENGYQVIYSGQKTYNGVAIFFRQYVPNNVLKALPAFDDPQRRFLLLSLGDLRILNLYVPNGESVISEKYQYKLNWLNSVITFLKTELTHYPNMIVLGDFNIAPHDIDVYDPSIYHQQQILCSTAERTSFNNLLKLGLNDCFRTFAPENKSFSWWDYRLNAFKRNMGLRIDHILVSAALMQNCKNCYIDQTTRAWQRPSDHAPVIAEFQIS